MNNDNGRSSNMLHLHVKELRENSNAFDFLLNNGYADIMINQKDHYGNTPFHYACYEPTWSARTDHFKKFLLRSGLLLNARNDKGRTPFHFACYSLNKYKIEALIANPNVNENEIDNQGENGLHCMIRCFFFNYAFYTRNIHYINSVHILLQNNPFLVTMKNNSGETPIDYAVKIHSICSDDKYVWINGKQRRLPCRPINDSWSTLVTVLQDYHTETKNLMYNYFMGTFINHIS
jgi:ankyrin repeat protein